MAQLPDGETAPLDGALPSSVVDGAAQRTFHGYVHIPFCSVRCGYCDFNTYTSSELRGVTKDSFQTNLLGEIDFARATMDRACLPARELSTVFFGGGTPTQLQAAQLGEVLAKLRDNFGITESAEITTEANPDNLDAQYAKALAAAGFTRVSLGMQSAVPHVLKTLDRSHDPENVTTAVRAAKDAGLQVSVDLIYGTPGESLDDWRVSVEAALALELDHVSAYSLIVEPGTKMARLVNYGQLIEASEDELAEKYELADQLFLAAGFRWYEVSNWSRDDSTASKHNLAYWQSNDWWGFGPGAHSHLGGTRWWNVKHPAAYAERIQVGNSPALAREQLDERTRLFERLLLEVRISQGISIDVIAKVSPNVSQSISELIADGLIDGRAAIGGRVVLTNRGRLLADAVVRRLS